jgi:integrase
MKGHIRERSLGHWAIVLEIRDAESGKRKRKWHSFKGTKREAQIERSRLIAELAGGNYVETTRLTVSDFLERWIEHMQGQVSPRSHERYAELCRKNIMPLLGGLMLTKLQPAHISQAYAKALTSGRRDGKGGLSARTVTHLHRVLREALQQALRWQLLARNPVDAVKPPKVSRKTMQTYDMAQTAELLETLRGERLFVPVILAVLCGLRRGEIAAIRWGQIDLAKAQLSVSRSAEQTRAGVRYKEPKSGRSRTVALSQTVVEELRAHRVSQAQELLRLGVRVTDETFVCARKDGNPLQPDSFTHDWDRKIAKTTLPRLRFHDLRHAHATHLLSSGVHPKVASERLGHSKIGITLDLYSHVLPNMQSDATAHCGPP